MNWKRNLSAFFISLLLTSATSQAHIASISIPSDETLQAGDVYDVEWEITIYHGSSMDTWDLLYSTESSTSGFIDIETDIPTLFNSPGNPYGLVQSYAWTVPNMVESDVWLRVVNSQDWILTSPQSFAIVPEPVTWSMLALGSLVLIRKRKT